MPPIDMPPIKTEYNLEKSLIQALVAQGHQERRDYLGMSSIGYCARQIYNDLLHGKPDEGGRMHWYAFAGNLWEHALIRLLGYEPSTEQIEVVARFETRFRGHVDHDLSDGTLIECKSTGWKKFQQLCAGPVPQHVDQVQMYLRHGGWDRAFIVYAARDFNHGEWTGIPIRCFYIRPDRARQDYLDAKAQMILEALDCGGPPPACDCGWCRL